MNIGNLSAAHAVDFESKVDLLTADEFLSTADYSNVLVIFMALRRKYSDHPEPFIKCGKALERLGREAEADLLLGDAVARFPAATAPVIEWINLATRRRDWDEVWRRSEEMRRRAPDDAYGYIRAARALRDGGRLKEADTAFAETVARFPGSVWALIEWTDCALARGDISEAEIRCDELQRRHPDHPFGFIGRARAARDTGRLDDADRLLITVIHRFPAEPSAWREWASIPFSRQHWAEALDRCREVKRRFPGLSFGSIGMARALRQLERLDEADEIFSEAIDRYPSDSFGIMPEWAEVPLLRKNWADAIGRCARLRARHPDHPFGYLGAAQAQREAGFQTEVEEFLAAALARSPANQAVCRAWADWQNSGKLWNDLYRSRLDALPRQDPIVVSKVPEQLRAMAIELDAGRYDDAYKKLEELLETEVLDGKIASQAADLFVRSGDFSRLRQSWAKIKRIGLRDPAALCNAIYRLYPCFSAEPGSEIFLDYLFGLPDNEPGINYALSTLTHFILRHECKETLGHTIRDYFLSSRRTKPAPLMRAGIGPLFADIMSQREYEDLFVAQIPFWSHVDGFVFGIFLPFAYLATNAVGYDQTRAEHISKGAEEAITILLHASTYLANPFRLLWILMIICDLLNSPKEMEVEAVVRQRLDDATAPMKLNSPEGILQHILTERDRRRAPIMKSPLLRRDPKICVEISGQMRGYRQAIESWKNIGFKKDEWQVVVHTWQALGGRLPSEPAFADRTFAGEFLAAYKTVLARFGWEQLQARYPTLIHGLKSSELVRPEQLEEVYGTKIVVIEDENVVAAQKNNQWKMHYKILKAHELALSTVPDADLYIRLRGDFVFETDLQLDWRIIWEQVRSGGIMLAQFGREFQALNAAMAMGDQLAIGTRDSMSAYSEAFLRVQEAQNGELFGFPKDYYGHLTLAYTTLYAGIKVRSIPRLTSGNPLLNSSRVDPSQVERWISMDLPSGPRDEFDHLLVESLKSDLKVAATS